LIFYRSSFENANHYCHYNCNYAENPPLYHQKLIHPSEKLPEKKLGKREFKKFKEYLIQKYPRRKSLQNLEYFSKIPKKFKDDYEEFLKIHKKL
jgi:hypothetical protein